MLRLFQWFNNGQHFFYFTNLSFISMGVYFVAVLVVSWRHKAASNRPPPPLHQPTSDIEMAEMPDLGGVPSQSDPCISHNSSTNMDSHVTRIICWIISLHFVVLAASSILVTLVYWTLLAEPQATSLGMFSNLSVHALNVVIMLAELALNAVRIRVGAIFIYLVVLMFYVFWAWIASEIWTDPKSPDSKFWVYAFLRLSEPKNGVFYVGILFGGCMIFLLVWSLICLKFRLVARRFPQIPLYSRKVHNAVKVPAPEDDDGKRVRSQQQ